MAERVAVIGAGVNGLTCAIELARAGHSVTIFARDLPHETTSAVPAAIWFPYHAKPEADVSRWALRTRERLRELAGDERTGVHWVDFSVVGIRFEPPLPSWAKPEELTRLDDEELAALGVQYRFGYRVSVPMMENPKYLRYLETTFIQELRGPIVREDLAALTDVPETFSVIVNCSGYGAKALCSDSELKPGRGVVVIASKRSTERHMVCDEGDTLTYVLSRENDCVWGGCDGESEVLAISRDEAEAIIRRCDGDAGVAAKLRRAEVGIRPVRDAVRLEAEWSGARRIVHNYGHGGSGFTLSWGCAEDVAELVAR